VSSFNIEIAHAALFVPQFNGGIDPLIDRATLQLRHSLLLQGSPPSGKLLIPLNRRDVRVVEGARLEIALAICDGVLQVSITVAKPTT